MTGNAPKWINQQVKRLGFNLGIDVDETTTVLAFGKYNHAVNEGIDCVILTHAYIQTGMMNSTALTLDDIARFSALTAKNLNTESCGFLLAAVIRKNNTIFMCHFILRFWGLAN